VFTFRLPKHFMCVLVANLRYRKKNLISIADPGCLSAPLINGDFFTFRKKWTNKSWVTPLINPYHGLPNSWNMEQDDDSDPSEL
jgi:hypothetical protein